MGLTAGYPATAGLLWQVSDRFALRPDVSWNWSSGESSLRGQANDVFSSLGSEISSSGFTSAFSLSGLLTVQRRESLRVYVGARGGWTRTNFTSTTTYSGLLPGLGTLPQTTSRTTSSDGYTFAGMFGGQYALGDRFGVFGEAGAAYSRSESESDSRIQSRASSVGLRSSVGVVVFF